MSATVPMAAVLAAFGLLMLSVRSLQMHQLVGPEIGRKLVHVGMGIIALSFPWIFRGARPVWIVASIAVALLSAVRLVPAITLRFGQVLGGVERASLGDFFFPLGVALAFTLAHGDAAAFCGAVGVLSFADSAGALVGTRWGRCRYSLAGSHKSVEGSATVFIVSLICVMLASILFDDKAWPTSLKNGLVIGIAATLVEAISSYGLDNLLLPVVVVELLKR